VQCGVGDEHVEGGRVSGRGCADTCWPGKQRTRPSRLEPTEAAWVNATAKTAPKRLFLEFGTYCSSYFCWTNSLKVEFRKLLNLLGGKN
jgi:hypothetical protein